MKPAARSRARAMGIQVGSMEPGPWNAITDVPGVEVGQVTHSQAAGDLRPGEKSVHTGVTVILPHEGDAYQERLAAAVHTINGYGKATGFEQVRETGLLETPIALTNTLNVGKVWDALVTWTIQHSDEVYSVNPLVGECNDSYLNDIQGRHVDPSHVLHALEGAATGPVLEGAVGAGTGMTCYEFKGGAGTASRKVGEHRLGVLLISNFGIRSQLVINGVPVGKELAEYSGEHPQQDGSVMVVVATDAPLSDRQLGRLARRVGMGLARTGSIIGDTSGDFVISFSTANRFHRRPAERISPRIYLPEAELNPFFQAVIESTEEAVLNSLCCAETTTGQSGHIAYALPLESVVEIMHRYGHPEVHLS